MTEVQPATTAAPPAPGLIARLIGVIFSPRATYAAVVARPRFVGAFAVTLVLSAAIQFAFLSTEIGQNAMFEQQLEGMENFGFEPTPQVLQQMEEGLPQVRYRVALFQIPAALAFSAILSGLLLVTLNAFLDGDAKFTHVFALVAHAGVIIILQQLFSTPINYLRGEMAAPASLSVFTPMLDPDGFVGGFLQAIDLFIVWWIISLAIGLGVLHKRRTGPIATALLCVYGIIALGFAVF